ncbi:MAG: dTDP-4-dehydrorhamnose reductase [Alphaproteobacteria bacterium]|nr:dTDP-4-dehydrorhamnose reductase [Alphaproteobacteria bacterium]
MLGSTGQLGRALQDAVTLGLGSGVASAWHWADRSQFDLAQPDRLAHALNLQQADVIINAAAYTAVDRAESEPDLAMRVNAESVKVLALHAQTHRVPLVHFSTDYVFDGLLDRPYVESDAPHPQSAYGQSKLQGEEYVRSLAPEHLIFRTSWVFARYGGNFIKTMLRLAQERDELRVVADQWGAPTSARCLAQASLHALTQAMADPGGQAPWGLYHLSCAGSTSWHGYACHVLERAAQWGAPLKARAQQVLAITTEQFPTPTRRPLNSSLDTERWVKTFGMALPLWQSEVDAVLADVLLDQGVLTPAMRDKITSERSAQ